MTRSFPVLALLLCAGLMSAQAGAQPPSTASPSTASPSAVAPPAQPARPAAAAQEAATSPIDALNRTLVASAGSGLSRRIATMAPVVADTFNIPVMARFVVGPSWTQMTPADRATIVAALRRYLAARFAHDFSTSPNVRVTIEPTIETRGLDKVVTTIVAEPGEDRDRVVYRMREYDGRWKAIDVIYNGVSELTTRRADLAGTASGGAAALAARIDRSAQELSR